MITAIALGGGFGLGVWVFLSGLVHHRPLAVVPEPGDGRSWLIRLGQPAVRPLGALGLPNRKLEQDLVLLGRTTRDHLATKAVLATTGLLLPLVLLGTAVNGFLLLTTGLLLAAAGFAYPDVRVRSRATELRTQFRQSLTAYLDLVWITLAGGAGVDSALTAAAHLGTGWGFDQVRDALDSAWSHRTAPWSSLHRLGTTLTINELTELAASLSLAGTEGAKVRSSLAAKAATVRAHQLAETEAAAQAATERMAMPVMLLFLGFLTFIAYPALDKVLNGL